MPRKTVTAENVEEISRPEDPDMELLTKAPDDWEFQVVKNEAPVKVDTEVGDVFIGQFEGVNTVAPENGDDPFDMFHLRGRDGILYAFNSSYDLEKAREVMPVGSWVRLTHMADVPTKKGNPMKSFRVEVRTK